MKKLLYVGALSALLLAACGETTEEKVGGNVENTELAKEGQAEKSAEEATTDSKDINQVVVDNEQYKATLLNIVKKSDDTWGNEINVTFEIENKTDLLITAQANNVSADGYMVDETILSMSQDVAAGKKAKAVLTISEFEGYDFPELKNDFEMVLNVFNGDTFDTLGEHDVKVSVQ